MKWHSEALVRKIGYAALTHSVYGGWTLHGLTLWCVFWEQAEARKKCFISDFYNAIDSRAIKHHQWITLSRDHARAVVDKAEEALARYKEAPRAGAGCIAARDSWGALNKNAMSHSSTHTNATKAVYHS